MVLFLYKKRKEIFKQKYFKIFYKIPNFVWSFFENKNVISLEIIYT